MFYILPIKTLYALEFSMLTLQSAYLAIYLKLGLGRLFNIVLQMMSIVV
jgi:hypothetical protein